MIARDAFSILEVLLATVLMATVAVVCTPYLRSRAAHSPEMNGEPLNIQVRRALVQATQASRAWADDQVYAEVAQLNGWVCERIPHLGPRGGHRDVGGTWIRISDGRMSSVHWVAPAEGGAP